MKAPSLHFFTAVLIAFACVTSSRAQVLADFATNYQGETVGSPMTLLTDTHGTGTWGYYLAYVNTDVSPTSVSGPEILTYQANTDGGSAPYVYGTIASNSYNVIDLPAVSNGPIFPDSANPATDYQEVHPGGSTAASLIQWTAGAGETGTLSLTFDLSRQAVASAGISGDPGSGYDDFTVYRNGTLIYSDYDMYLGPKTLANPNSDTGSVTLTLSGVTAGTNLDFVTSASNGILGYNLSFLSADISAIPEPSTWALFGLGGLVLAVVFKRRQLSLVRR
jgi:hypothetical protein